THSTASSCSLFGGHTHTHAHIYTHTHPHTPTTLKHTLTLFLSRPPPPHTTAPSCALFGCDTHTHTHTLSLSLPPHSHTLFLSLSLMFCHNLSLFSISMNLILPLSRSHKTENHVLSYHAKYLREPFCLCVTI